jgi:hypothetical protein
MDILDSRDLQYMLDAFDFDATEDHTAEERRYVREIIELKNATEYCGWESGIQFIPVNEFKEYAQDLAYDIGALNNDDKWPYTCIDWDFAAKELAYDYSMISFDGSDYYYREA